jgi:DMSO/TMAO reductase YedYZ molybdopterin-dependent catalytic subunit
MSVLKQLETPVFYAEGMPRNVTAANYTLTVDGLLSGAPRSFTFADLEAMPLATVNARLTSVSGWTVRADWQGVRFTDFLAALPVDSWSETTTHVNFTSFGRYTTCVPLDALRYEKVLVCYKVGDEYLELEYGGPVRIFIPHLWGYKSCKGLARMTFTDRAIPGYWETRGYPDRAEIEPGRILDINSGETRTIPGGEVVEF